MTLSSILSTLNLLMCYDGKMGSVEINSEDYIIL